MPVSVQKGPSEAAQAESRFDRIRGTAFGLGIEAPFAIKGLSPGLPGLGPPPTADVRLAIGSAREIASAVRGRECSRLREWRAADGEIEQWVGSYGRAGFRLVEVDFGSYLISPQGTRVICAPNLALRTWQRLLVGQVLPLAAVLQGIELFHASAVGIAGGAIAIAGSSQIGKTSIAVRLVQRGAIFLADDVVAIDPGDPLLRVKPGIRVVNLRHSEAAQMSPQDRRRLGRVIGADPDVLRLELPEGRRPDRDPPLRALYLPHRVVTRATSERNEPSFSRLPDPDPRQLLGNAFSISVRTPERLRRQLDHCARVAREVPIFRLGIPSGATAAHVAERLEHHASTVAGGGG